MLRAFAAQRSCRFYRVRAAAAGGGEGGGGADYCFSQKWFSVRLRVEDSEWLRGSELVFTQESL
jgi:hypothetical protein